VRTAAAIHDQFILWEHPGTVDSTSFMNRDKRPAPSPASISDIAHYDLPFRRSRIGGIPGVAGAVIVGPSLASATTGCSPVTDIPNPNVTGGATEWIFAGVQNNGLGTICAPGGCLMNFKNQPRQAPTVYAAGQQGIRYSLPDSNG
jgi:hypothetical protein